MVEITQKVSALRDRLIAGVSQIPCAVLNGDLQNRLPGNVSFCFDCVEGESLVLLLNAHGICAASGSACTSASLEPSHVLRAIGRSDALARGALRLSLSKDNSLEEIEEVLWVLPGAVEKLRNKRMSLSMKKPH